MSKSSKRLLGNPLMMFFLGLLCLAAIVLVALPIVMKKRITPPQIRAVSNAKNVFFLLIEFEEDHGMFPTDATAKGELVNCKGDYSNDYLSQLVIGGYIDSEEIFYAKGGTGGTRKPDNVIFPATKILEEGECGFAYIKNLSMQDKSATPVLLAPMFGDGFKFNNEIYRNRALVLHVDGSVKQYQLNDDLLAIVDGEKTLFQSGEKTVWGEKGFDQSNLVYANSPYEFQPSGIDGKYLKLRDMIMASLAILIVFLIIWTIRKSRKKTRMHQ